MKLWDDTPYIAFDTETTGFSREDRICEIAICLARGSEVIREFHTLIDPGVSIDPGAEAVHGISNQMVAGKPRFEDVKSQILDYFRLDVPWVAHNFSFDARMLGYVIPREEWPTGVPTLCTMDFAKKKHPRLSLRRGHKLMEVAGALGINYSPDQAHNALNDTHLLVQVVPRMMEGRSVEQNYTKMSEQWLK